MLAVKTYFTMFSFSPHLLKLSFFNVMWWRGSFSLKIFLVAFSYYKLGAYLLKNTPLLLSHCHFTIHPPEFLDLLGMILDGNLERYKILHNNVSSPSRVFTTNPEYLLY